MNAKKTVHDETEIRRRKHNSIFYFFYFVNLCPVFIFSHLTVVMYNILYVNDVTVISSLFIEAV